jgi:hypothetical protein
MIDAKKAVELAKEKAAELFSAASSLEEIERDSDRDREVWSITLGLPRELGSLSALAQLSVDRRQYKRFLIDVETGELVAVRMREVASQ